jgi:hypothetical protein
VSTYYLNEGAFELLDPEVVDRKAPVCSARPPAPGDVRVRARRSPCPEHRSRRERVAGWLAGILSPLRLRGAA